MLGNTKLSRKVVFEETMHRLHVISHFCDPLPVAVEYVKHGPGEFCFKTFHPCVIV